MLGECAGFVSLAAIHATHGLRGCATSVAASSSAGSKNM